MRQFWHLSGFAFHKKALPLHRFEVNCKHQTLLKMKPLLCFLLLLLSATSWAIHRNWMVNDGLPTGEVQQIIELPNRQMLVNCEGVFCLSNGVGFDVIACDYSRAFPMERYAKGYGYMWQGDSLLWLHDFYRVYLFDARRRAFRYDVKARLTVDKLLRQFAKGLPLHNDSNDRWQRSVDSLGLSKNCNTVTQDCQGGLWIGTRSDGIVYLSPRISKAEELFGNNPLIGIARSVKDQEGRIWRCKADGVECEEKENFTLYNRANVKGLPHNRTTFIQQLSKGCYILCDSLSTLGYFYPSRHEFKSLNVKLPTINKYRHFVGACPLDGRWTVVYAQNGIFMLDTQADTIASFPPAADIERYATKYNCMVRDNDGKLWIGTQNGLFLVDPSTWNIRRIEGIRNNCIRSLTLDLRGRVWAGTACGISRITPSAVNLGEEDGIPAASMMERAACLTDDGQLVFVLGGSHALMFHPDAIIDHAEPLSVVITAFRVNGRQMDIEDCSLSHNQNNITLHFSTLDYAAPSHTSYRYRLSPLEKEWNIINGGSGQGSAHYMALQHGTYHIELQACASGGEWGEPTVMEMEIRPPVWLTWWAKTFYVLLAFLTAALLAHLYLKKRKQQMERLNEERVNRLFELRDEARHQFAQSVNIVPKEISTNKEEELLVEKLLKAIGENMDNTDYTVDQMASDIAMSRANLYKKTQQMLGITPNEFLRNVRLKHAASLLESTDMPVNQISLTVGFQTARYFSQCFRQMFGVTPTEFRNGNCG